MVALRIALGLALGYTLLVVLAWLLQERLAFPAPRAPVPDPRRLGIPRGERIELALGDGQRLVGWYLGASAGAAGAAETPGPRPLWFFGHGGDIAPPAPRLPPSPPPRPPPPP